VQEIEQEVTAQATAIASVHKALAREAGDFAKAKEAEAKANGDAEGEKLWKEGGAAHVLLHTGLGLLTGNVAGAVGAAAASLAAPVLSEVQDGVTNILKDAGASDVVAKETGKIVASATAAAGGAIVSGSPGAAAALNTEMFNRQLHPDETKWIKDNAKRFAQQLGISEQEAEQRLAQQAARQVQNGMPGQEDAQSRAFLSQAKGMLAADPSCPSCGPGYMFYATPEQKANPNMYANTLSQTETFYRENNISQPTPQQITQSVAHDQTLRNTVMQRTILAAMLSGTLVLAPAASGIATEAAAFAKNPVGYCISNPAGCTVAAETVAYTAAGVPQVGSGVLTPHGIARQANSPVARVALDEAQSGTTLYRQGSFGVQNTTDAQFWSFQNPASTKGFANQMGMPGDTAKPDWIMGGQIFPGSPIITRPAPGIGANVGGSMEAVVPEGGVRHLWFHMPN